MDPEKWRKLSQIYHGVLACPAEERSAFLDSTCGGDSALRAEIESLIGQATVPTANFSASSTIGSYRIERLLGVGGIGSVFLAYDPVLHRRVALKVIHDVEDAEASRARLLREARNAAALNHPNICVIHEVNEAQGTPFIAMEYVEGVSLRDRIDAGMVSLEDALRYGIQAADALAHAHDHSVVHRDFKAANAIVTDNGWLKVVDFGLARRADAPMLETTMVSLVPAGTAAGTPYAMAPEQVRGESASARSDIWALGVLLYEMVTGEQPFRGATVAEVFSSILRDAPPPLPSSVPAEIEAVVARCLQKEPAHRFTSAHEVRGALEQILPKQRIFRTVPSTRGWWAAAFIAVAVFVAAAMAISDSFTGYLRDWVATMSHVLTSTPGAPRGPTTAGVPLNRRSVGVIGFRNVSGQPDVAYISTALDEGIASDLAAGDRLRIVSTEEVARLKRDLHLVEGNTLAPDTLRLVKAGLGIDLVVTGSYTAVGRGDGKQVRVDIRVQDTGSGQVLGALSSTHPESELLALISESGAGLRRALGFTGVDTTETSVAALPTSLDARRLYAEGLNAMRAFDATRARDLFEKSIAREPDFALAHIALANAWSILGYDASAAREASAAASLSKGLREADRIWIEGLRREYTREWAAAIAAYRTLATDYPDEPEYALKLANAQISAGAAKDALETIGNLTRTVAAATDDPRVFLAEADAAESLGDATREEKAAAAAVAAAQRQGSALLVARASINLAWAEHLLGKLPDAKITNERARRLFEEAGDRRGVARALIQLGGLSRETGDLKGAEATLRTAVEISRNLGNNRQLTQSLNELANVMFRQRRFSAAADTYTDAIAASRELGDQNAEARALGNLASVRYEQGDVTEANRLDEQALAIKRAIGDQRSIAFSLINIAETAADLGRLDDAERMYTESRAITETLNVKLALAYSLNGLSVVALRRDQLPLAQQLIEQTLALRRQTRDTAGVLDAQISLANILLERGQIDAAAGVIKGFSESPDAAPEQSARAAVVRARMLREQGQPAEGRKVLSSATKRSTEGFSAATAVALDLEDARLLAAIGNATAAARKAGEVAARERKRGLLAFQLEAELVAADVARGDRDIIMDLVRRARAAKFNLIARKGETLLSRGRNRS
jgi:tRNA A-37 threonylcarbamoyl transferase component Bud32/tetratricopeptide (TPR) repeat protein/TolB-like protein